MTRSQMAGALVLVGCAVAWVLVLVLMEPTYTPGAKIPQPSCQPGPPVLVNR